MSNKREKELVSKLYPPEVIKRMNKSGRKDIGQDESVFQPNFWPETSEKIETVDPEKKMHQLGWEADRRFYYPKKNSPLVEEIAAKRDKLRNRIGLPIARGKDPHVKDKFYKYLVKRIYRFDELGIFSEYDRVIDEEPKEMKLKIDEVKELVNKLLNGNMGMNERYNFYHQFVEKNKNCVN